MHALPTSDSIELEASEIDIALIDYNLSLTYEQRIDQHQSALDLVLELRRIGEHRRLETDETRSR